MTTTKSPPCPCGMPGCTSLTDDADWLGGELDLMREEERRKADAELERRRPIKGGK